MKYKDGAEELYDMKKDPKQFNNLMGKSKYREQIRSIRNLFENRTQSIR